MKTKKQHLSYLRHGSLATLCLMLAACGSSAHQDLRNFTDKVKADAAKVTTIDALPDIQPYETYLYRSDERRDPFTNTVAADDETIASTDDSIRPPSNHRKEALEAFPLDSLRMVGTLQRDDTLWAIVKIQNNPDGGIHRIVTGNYLGQNYGRVINVSEEKINLIEVIPNGLGGWREREASIALSEE
ncbi:MAG: pilus assembly protein PilP [Sulfuriflexus sp.]|nr:pilus assembly protein PilP [Sulfuriflexus sp.]